MASNSLLMVNLPRNHMVNASEFSSLSKNATNNYYWQQQNEGA